MANGHRRTPLHPAVACAGIGIFLLAGVEARGQVAVSPNDVAVEQVDWSLDGAGNDTSNTGEMIVNEASLATDSGISNGYINVQTSAGWAVQNLPVVSGVPYLAVNFALGNADGTADTGPQNFSIDITAAPLQSFTPAPSTQYNVGAVQEDPQGGDGTEAGAAPGPPAVGTNGTFNKNGVTRLKYQLGHQNVQAADNQCVPAATANVLTYETSLGNIIVPDANNPGRGTGAAVVVPTGLNDATHTNEGAAGANASLVGKLDNLMSRGSTSRISGNPTRYVNLVPGTEKYLGPVNSTARIDTQGLAVVTNNGITNTNVAGTLPDFLYNELTNSAGIVMDYNWTSPGFNFGHSVQVLGSGSLQDRQFVIYNSDLAQTDEDGTDVLLNKYTTLPFGLAQGFDIPRFSYLDTTAGGGLGYTLSNEAGGNAVLNVMAVVPEPTALLALLAMPMLLIRTPRRGTT